MLRLFLFHFFKPCFLSVVEGYLVEGSLVEEKVVRFLSEVEGGFTERKPN